MEFYTANGFLLVISIILLYPSSSFQKMMSIQDADDLAKCGTPKPWGARVIGGDIAGHWPWHAQLRIKADLPNKFKFLASGVLINKNWVLTGAHVVQMIENTTELQVALGKNKRELGEFTERIYDVSEIRIHTNFTLNGPNIMDDIALVKLSKKVKYTPAIRPACLPKANEREKVGKHCTLTGWGYVLHPFTSSQHKFAEKLQKVELPVANFTRCNRTYEKGFWVDNATMFCAGYGHGTNKSGCRHDSGGPFSCAENNKYVVRGILNGGQSSYCLVTNNRFNIFIRVSAYIDWIKEQVNSPPPVYPECVDNHWACCIFAKQYECTVEDTYYMGNYMRFKYCPITCRNPKCQSLSR